MKNLPDGVTIAGGGLPLFGIVQTASNAESVEFETDADAATFVVATGNDFYYEGATEFALTAEGCILTYTGPDITVLTSLQGNFQFTSAAADREGALVISQNGELIGQAIFSNLNYRAGTTIWGSNASVTQTRLANAALQRRLVLQDGDTIQPLCAANAGTDVLIVSLTMSILQVAAIPI